MRRIDLADFMLVAEAVAGIAAERLVRISRVVALAESALPAPFAGFGDVDLFPTVEERRPSTARGS